MNTHQDGMAFRAGAETEEALNWAANRANVSPEETAPHEYSARDNQMVVDGTKRLGEAGSVEPDIIFTKDGRELNRIEMRGPDVVVDATLPSGKRAAEIQEGNALWGDAITLGGAAIGAAKGDIDENGNRINTLTGKPVSAADIALSLSGPVGDIGKGVSKGVKAVANLASQSDVAIDAAKTGSVIKQSDKVISNINPNVLERSHSISGKNSSKKVNLISDSMRQNGYVGDPIDIVEVGGRQIIVDGHHRAAAARRTNTPVNVKVVDNIKNHSSSFDSVDEVVTAADETGLDKLRPPKK